MGLFCDRLNLCSTAGLTAKRKAKFSLISQNQNYLQVADSKCLYISNDPIWPFTSSGDAFSNRAEEKCAKMGLSLVLLDDPESDESIALKEISSKII